MRKDHLILTGQRVKLIGGRAEIKPRELADDTRHLFAKARWRIESCTDCCSPKGKFLQEGQ